MTDDTDHAAPKRQARGRKRIAELLDAAAEVFAEKGFKGAGTNAIAAKAGASPGTLYQFFRNKHEIATALMDRYVDRLREAHGEAFDAREADLPLEELVDRVVDPLIAFDRANPGFYALLADPDLSPELAAAKKPAQKIMYERLDAMFAARSPSVPETERRRSVEVAVHIFRGLLPMIMAAPADELPQIAAETKRALRAYLEPVLGLAGAERPLSDDTRSSTPGPDNHPSPRRHMPTLDPMVAPPRGPPTRTRWPPPPRGPPTTSTQETPAAGRQLCCLARSTDGEGTRTPRSRQQ